MSDVKKAAAAYVNKHTGLKGLFKGYSKEKGIPRNNIAKKLKADEYEFGFDFAGFGEIMLNIIATIFFPIPITYRWIRCVIDGIRGDFASREPMESSRPW